jgi:hypothetical protein
MVVEMLACLISFWSTWPGTLPAERQPNPRRKDYRAPVGIELPHFYPFCELGELRTVDSAKEQTQTPLPERRPHGTR